MEDKVLLDVQGLKTYFHTFKGVVKAVDNVSFSLKEGEILGIVGESWQRSVKKICQRSVEKTFPWYSRIL